MQLLNAAAWLPQEKAQLQVADALFPVCAAGELIIENHVVAVNPIDWKVQSYGGFSIDYPAILGMDIAGKIVHVGDGVQDKFSVGQRVMAHTMGFAYGSSYGGFQYYVTVKGVLASVIPETLSFTEAASLPLAISTAAAGLYRKAMLGLPYPPTGEAGVGALQLPTAKSSFLVWGGSSSVGSAVIQLASASGFAVITTASPSNFDYCRALGAEHVLDYHESDVVTKLISIMRKDSAAGAFDAIGSDATVRQCAATITAVGGGRVASVGMAPKGLYDNVTLVRVNGSNMDTNEPEVAERIWGDYVPSALRSGTLVPSLKPLVVGHGLESVQEGLYRQKQGVSASKVEIILRQEN